MHAMTRTALMAAVVSSLLVYGAPTVAETSSVATPEARMHHISITTMGSHGSPIILIPGLATPRAVWDGVAPELARSHRVLLVQVNGFAGDDPGANLSPGVLTGCVTDLDSYIAINKLGSVAVVGHSMGGLIAMMLAKAHLADVSKLMIVDSLPFFPVLRAPLGVEVTAAMVQPQAAVARDKLAATYGKSMSDADAEAQTKGLALKPSSISSMKAWAMKADARVTAEVLYEDLTTDLRRDLAAITAPITVVYPWNATFPTKAMAGPFYQKQYAAAPSVTYVVILPRFSGHPC